jgi:hypothetical protein
MRVEAYAIYVKSKDPLMEYLDRDYDHEKPTKTSTLAKSDHVDAEAYTSKQQRLALKQHWSAYFTILAAAFGLISDGCKCSRRVAFR